MSHNKYQNTKKNAFTLVEMLIVLIIMGILLLFTAFLSGEQIQKIKDKSVKESILSERQSRYSRNLWSSSFAWIMYKDLDIGLESGDNKFSFTYKWNSTWLNNSFNDNFIIKSIITNTWDNIPNNIKRVDNLIIKYHPYQMYCERWKYDSNLDFNTWDMKDSLVIVTRVNDSKDYCFEIKPNNCKLLEVSETLCNYFIKNN